MQVLRDRCPICSHEQTQFLYRVAAGQLVRCCQCRLVFYTPQPTAEELAAFYDRTAYRDCYESSAMAGQPFAQGRYTELCTVLQRYIPGYLPPRGKHLLDIGCGVGDLLNTAVKDGWEVTGTEISAIAAAQAGELTSRIQVGDVLTLALPRDTYDLITLYHVIEHLRQPLETLTQIHTLLRPKGNFFLETPNWGGLGARLRGRHWSHIIPPEHLTYFDANSLAYALRLAGFRRFHIFTGSPQVIGSVTRLPPGVRHLATAVYRLAPVLGLGAALQAIAFKD